MDKLLILLIIASLQTCYGMLDSHMNLMHPRQNDSLPLMQRMSSVKRHILRHYDHEVPPVLEYGHPVNVSVSFTLITFSVPAFAHDSAEHPVKFSGWLVMGWNDPRLQWNVERSRVREVHLNPHDIWIPDLAVFNSIDAEHVLFVKDTKTRAVVFGGGHVSLVTPVEFIVVCDHRERELYRCPVKIGSWTYNGNLVDVHLPKPGDAVDTSYFMPSIYNARILATHGKRVVKKYELFEDPYPLITLTFDVNKID